MCVQKHMCLRRRELCDFLMFEGNREQQTDSVLCPVIDVWECTIGIIMFLSKHHILTA